MNNNNKISGEMLYNLIKPHLGSISATGDHSVDMERVENFDIRSELINCLLNDLEKAYFYSRESSCHSVQTINQICIDEMKSIINYISDYVYDHESSN